MKKVTPKGAGKSRASNTAQRLGAAALVMLPLTVMSTRAEAQAKTAATATPIKTPAPSLSLNFAKVQLEYEILGVGDGGKTFFQGQDRRIFTVDPKTGDLRFVTNDFFIKISSKDLKSKTETFFKYKFNERVHILGADAQGNVILSSAPGQRFYLNAHGDMVSVK